jgi:dolichyl-phosphate beta-glucosyltransferase
MQAARLVDAGRHCSKQDDGVSFRSRLPPRFPIKRCFAMSLSTQEQRRADTIVVIPCYNEAKRLDVPAFDHFLYSTPGVSFLFVDDGSTDDTPHIVERLRQRHPRQVCTLRLAANCGKAEAVRRGICAALRRGPKTVGYWDADLATPLDAILQLEAVLRQRPKIDLVMGSRVALLGRQIRRSGVRHLLGRAFATAAALVLGLPVYDTQCGAKLFRVTPATAEMFARPFDSRWIFDVEILARMIAALAGSSSCSVCPSIYEHPLDEWQDIGDSRLTPMDFLIAAIDLAGIYWRYIRRPARPLSSASASSIQHPASDIEHRKVA